MCANAGSANQQRGPEADFLPETGNLLDWTKQLDLRPGSQEKSLKFLFEP